MASGVVVTVPMRAWQEWIDEGDLPGQEAEYESHFWLARPVPFLAAGVPVWIVAHGRVRGYAPLVRVENRCTLDPTRGCLLREGGAVARTVACQRWRGGLGTGATGLICERSTEACQAMPEAHPAFVRGFQGYRRVWWRTEWEMGFPSWMTDSAPADVVAAIERQGAAGSVR